MTYELDSVSCLASFNAYKTAIFFNMPNIITEARSINIHNYMQILPVFMCFSRHIKNSMSCLTNSIITISFNLSFFPHNIHFMLLFSMGVINIKTTPNILCTTVYLP